ncbi:sorbitol dehydrogenase family protein [Erwinia sp. S63]|uniref:sorbitol dehydrogenase family protein n=1 Tax=Erwinia sp. S63 TaxID=2769341 RepID=UPI00190A64CC|nr:sorbitol dehydrogenase family protein [Erwinia sp. S63]MBK0097237.1 sorbitol dehydrogenase family protein [Erwinia sp. S63]
MSTSQDLPLGEVQLSRRRVLLSGVVIVAGGLITSALPRLAFADSSKNFIPFMQISRLLVNHKLDDAVGQRMLALLELEQPDLMANLNHLLAIAKANKAQIVEDFFPAIPQGELQALAHKIIFGWYTGCLEPKRSAKAFAYEQALTWQTTLDTITIPSYGISGPNNWQRANTPVLPVPQF